MKKFEENRRTLLGPNHSNISMRANVKNLTLPLKV